MRARAEMKASFIPGRGKLPLPVLAVASVLSRCGNQVRFVNPVFRESTILPLQSVNVQLTEISTLSHAASSSHYETYASRISRDTNNLESLLSN